MTHEEETREDHKAMKQRLAKLERDFEWHAGEGHATLLSGETVRDLVQQVDEKATANALSLSSMNDGQQLILDSLVGPKSALSGQRETTSGALHKIDTMWSQTMNGGIKSKLSPFERLLIAVIAAAASILSAWLSSGI